MQRHDNGNIFLLCHTAQDGQKLQLIFHIQKGSRLVQNHHIRLLTNRSGKQHPLSIADIREIPHTEFPGMHHSQRLLHLLLIIRGQNPEFAGIRIASACHDIVTGHQLRLDAVGQNDSHA